MCVSLCRGRRNLETDPADRPTACGARARRHSEHGRTARWHTDSGLTLGASFRVEEARGERPQTGRVCACDPPEGRGPGTRGGSRSQGLAGRGVRCVQGDSPYVGPRVTGPPVPRLWRSPRGCPHVPRLAVSDETSAGSTTWNSEPSEVTELPDVPSGWRPRRCLQSFRTGRVCAVDAVSPERTSSCRGRFPFPATGESAPAPAPAPALVGGLGGRRPAPLRIKRTRRMWWLRAGRSLT